jgi:hypothetical protein
MARQVKIFSKAALRRPLPPDRPLNTPQYNLIYGRRRKDGGPKNIPRLRNGKRLKDIVKRLEIHRSTNRDDFIKHRADYLIAAACHCPDSVELQDWLPHWAADCLHVPGAPDLDAKLAVAIACAPDRLSAEEVAELLPTTFDDRQWMKLWTFGACDMTPQQRRKRSKQEKKHKDRQRTEKKRRAAGAKPHAESLSRTKPWKAEGISRSTWERRRKKAKADKGVADVDAN